MPKRIDRREEKTRQALHSALIALLMQKKYESITIQEIIDTANVGRATFYSHYGNKDDLWRAGFRGLENQLRAIRRSSEEFKEPLGFSKAMFEHAWQYREVFRALLGRRAGHMATSEIRRVLTTIVEESKVTERQNRFVPNELAARFLVDTLIIVLRWWMEQEPQTSPAEANSLYRRLVGTGLGVKVTH
jgi:AcrR family transcriptional regulator